MDFTLILLLWVASAGIGGAITNSKNRGFAEGALWGGLLGCLGLAIVVFLPTKAPQAPLGLRAITCPRCNAAQNVPMNAPFADCWQCHLQIDMRNPNQSLS